MYKPKLIICAGAGISAESGIPTFRNAGGEGLWENHDLNRVCSMPTFYDNYMVSNQFYIDRVAKFIGAKPNSAHQKIASLQDDFEVICITSNIDTLFEQAGVKPENVLHVHGRLDEVVTNYGTDHQKLNKIASSDEYLALLHDSVNYPVKPNVVFFGEHAPLYQNMYNTFANLSNNDVIIVVGSSEQVVDFANEARVSRYTGRIFFVNIDRDLCQRQQKCNLVIPFCGTAVSFFNQVTQDKMGHYCFPTGFGEE